jgi:oligoendopeptidase F
VTTTEQPSAEELRWDLSDLFAGVDDPAWGAAVDRCLADAAAFAERYRGTIAVAGGPSAAHLRGALVDYEALQDDVVRVQAFARLMHAADSRDPAVRELIARADQFATELRNRLLFLDLEWLDVAEADAQRLIADPALAAYANYLRRERLNLPHKLSEPEEKIANEKDLTGRRAWTKFWTELTSSLTFPLEVDGQTKKLTMPEVLTRLQDADRSVRRAAHDALFGVLAEQNAALTFAYDTLVQDHLTMDRLRSRPDPMQERHLANDIPGEAVEQMMAVVEEAYPVAQRYFRAKARMVGLGKLKIYDQYAPVGAPAPPRSYDESRAIVLDAFGAFDRRVRDLAAEFFDRRWIDAEVRPGKRNGAFCSYPTPTNHPYVLMSYTGKRRDVMTLAHELGHGVHGQLARGQTLVNYHPPLPLAETASVFGEMLVFDHVLALESDPAQRRALIAGTIEDMFATVFRQNVLTRFEQGVYAARREARLTADRLNGLWLDANRAYYGDALELTEGYQLGWSYIPHFVNTRFYCYAYTFGELLVLALYRLYRERGRAFVPDYIKLLELGGSVSPAEAVGALGLDVRDRDFWRLGLAEIERLVDSLTEEAH